MKGIVIFAILAAGFSGVFADSCSEPTQKKGFADFLEKTYGVLGKTTDEILSHDTPEVFNALCWRIGQKAARRGESHLSQAERKLLAICDLEGEVNNGGFDQYFFNSAGDNAEAALAALREIGAVQTAALLERAMAVFPDGKPPVDRSKRQEVMEKIKGQSKSVWERCDEAFYKLTENIDGLALTYAKKHRAEIVLR